MTTRTTGRSYTDQDRRKLDEFIGRAAERIRSLTANALGTKEQALLDSQSTLDELRTTAAQLGLQNDELLEALARILFEQQKYQTLFEHMPEGYLVTDESGAVLEANHAATQLLGLAHAAMMGKPILAFVPLERRETFRELLRRLGTAGVSVLARTTLQPRQGPSVPIEINAVSEEADGKHSIRWSLRDLSNLRRARRARRAALRERGLRIETQRSSRRLRFIAESNRALGADSVAALIDGVSRAAARYLADECEILTYDGNGFRSGARHARSPESAQRAAAQRRAMSILRQLTELTRNRRPLVFPVVPVASSETDILRLLRDLPPRRAIILPIQAQKQLLGALCLFSTRKSTRFGVEEIATALELAARTGLALDRWRLHNEVTNANEAKTEFLAVLSHELRTPLAAVMGYADLLLQGVGQALESPARDWVESIMASAQHQARLVDDLLAYGRLTTQAVRIDAREFDVLDVIHEAVSVVHNAIEQKGIRLDLPPTTMRLSSDPNRVRQILINLLWNALKFTNAGSIAVVTESDRNHTTLSVIDTGIGMSQADLDRAFEAFWQADRTRPGSFRSLGLGLAVSRRLAEQLGGRLTARSTPGVGSTFILELPTLGADSAELAEPA